MWWLLSRQLLPGQFGGHQARLQQAQLVARTGCSAVMKPATAPTVPIPIRRIQPMNPRRSRASADIPKVSCSTSHNLLSPLGLTSAGFGLADNRGVSRYFVSDAGMRL